MTLKSRGETVALRTWTEVLLEQARNEGWRAGWKADRKNIAVIAEEAARVAAFAGLKKCEKCGGQGIQLTDGLDGRRWNPCSGCAGSGIAKEKS